MNTRSRSALLAGTAGVLAVVALPLWAAAPGGHLMDLTVQVRQTVSGMAPLAPRTLHKQICVQPGDFDPRAFVTAESRSECAIHNYAKRGDTVTFDLACTGAEPVTSHGEFKLAGPDFTGSMHTAFNAAGHAITVDTDYTGKQVGACDYHVPTASG